MNRRTTLDFLLITSLLVLLLAYKLAWATPIDEAPGPVSTENVAVAVSRSDASAQPETDSPNLEAPAVAAPTSFLTPEVAEYLSGSAFTAPPFNGDGWERWIIVSADEPWTVDELEAVRAALSATITAMDTQGLDGRALLEGYRFRRQAGEFVDGISGRMAVVNHGRLDITLADTAFIRNRGFSIYHELGHVVDVRTGRQLTSHFHNLVGSSVADGRTASGFWLNHHAETDLEEATADAFALWMTMDQMGEKRPLFWHTPAETDFELIAETFATSLGMVVSESL